MLSKSQDHKTRVPWLRVDPLSFANGLAIGDLERQRPAEYGHKQRGRGLSEPQSRRSIDSSRERGGNGSLHSQQLNGLRMILPMA